MLTTKEIPQFIEVPQKSLTVNIEYNFGGITFTKDTLTLISVLFSILVISTRYHKPSCENFPKHACPTLRLSVVLGKGENSIPLFKYCINSDKDESKQKITLNRLAITRTLKRFKS